MLSGVQYSDERCDIYPAAIRLMPYTDPRPVQAGGRPPKDKEAPETEKLISPSLDQVLRTLPEDYSHAAIVHRVRFPRLKSSCSLDRTVPPGRRRLP